METLPITCASRALSHSKTNYPASEKEQLKTLWATTNFRNYLFEEDTYFSDHFD